MLKRFDGSLPIYPTANSLSPLEASPQNLFHFSLEFPRGLYWASFFLLRTHNLFLTLFSELSHVMDTAL